MTIGGSIALIILGAILAFAVELTVAGISITAVGFILMIGGIAGLVFGMFFAQRATTTTTRTEARPVATERRVVEERGVADERDVY